MDIIKLTKSQQKFLKEHASELDGQYYYLPYWFRKTDIGYEVYSFDGLPQYIKKMLRDKAEKEIRENLNKPYPITEIN